MIAKYSTKIKFFYSIAEIVFWLIIKIIHCFSIRRKENNSRFKILLLEPYQMGDVISLSLLLDPLEEKFPDSDIYILCKTANFFENDKRVKGVFQTDFGWTTQNENRWKSIKKWFSMLNNLKKIREFNFDIGIETRGDIRSQFILNFICAKQIIGYNQAITTDLKNFGFLVNKKVFPNPKYKHRFEWNLYLLTSLGIEENKLFPVMLPSFRVGDVILNKNNDEKYILIHIGAGWKYKLWKNENWILLIQKLLQEYALQIKIIGGEKEKKDLEFIAEKFQYSSRFISQVTDFQQLTFDILHSEIFICLDSGPQNLASCLNTKVVVLFGPGHSEAFRPYNSASRFIHKIETFNCHPCFQQNCQFSTVSCMTKITVEDVLYTISTLDGIYTYKISPTIFTYI
ncbi:glycosyltransferase family 9 protein [Emticicia sp. SJ17W-69]|uniref:glycosyltransferase family 9 protein n=1 Tax=Emticicia sp. SJ17W-69 TaxID=3421657 RepID=UPI003EB7C1E7